MINESPNLWRTKFEKKLDDEIEATCKNLKLLERARDIIAKHHGWQNESEDLFLEFERDGETVRVDISGEYMDSSLCEETMEVLSALNHTLSN